MAFLGLFVVLIGAACLYWGWTVQSKASAQKAAAARWPTTPGTITAASVVMQGQAGGRGGYWVPSLSYDYSVNGQAFVGHRIRFGFVGSQSRSTVERMIAPYAVGSTGLLRYDPQNPRESVLEPDSVTSNMLVTAIGGAVLILLGLLVVFVGAQG